MAEINQDTSEFLYEKVARVFQEGIEGGALAAGDRVPSLRTMSHKLGVSIATINQAYVKLEDNGVIESRPQSGFYVREQQRLMLETPSKKTAASRPRKVDILDTMDACLNAFNRANIVPLGLANPATELLPVRTLTKIARQVAKDQAGANLEYNLPPGLDDLRKQIAFRSMDGGTMLGADSVLTTTGAVEALTLSLSAVTK
ncbi:MAG: GntR family transcriptional regulator, partial [Gammaproteobacteria bacterium]|nr:GntR family transcriptional regulator [Gammaproteobacteria bacterium]